MQEEVENRTVALAVSTTRMTGRVLKAALIKLLAEMKKSQDSPPQIPHGKQTVKELIGQNDGVSNIEITDKNIKSFEQVARKYGVDYALKKDTPGEKPKYLVFWIFKTFVAVLLVTHTFDIVMGIFDMAQSVVNSASGVISADASVGPIPMATMVNREWGGMGQNYLRSLLALAFQAFLIMVCVGIYAAVIRQINLDKEVKAIVHQENYPTKTQPRGKESH